MLLMSAAAGAQQPAPAAPPPASGETTPATAGAPPAATPQGAYTYNPAGRRELEASLGGHLRQINATLDPHERLQCVVVVTSAWTVDNGMITPTFKVKRNCIEDLYARKYEGWEASGKQVLWDDG